MNKSDVFDKMGECFETDGDTSGGKDIKDFSVSGNVLENREEKKGLKINWRHKNKDKNSKHSFIQKFKIYTWAKPTATN